MPFLSGKQAIRRGLATGGPYVVDVRIDGAFKA